MRQDVKLLIIACNTSSAYGYEQVKRELDIPVIEVIEPGAVAGLAATKNGRIGVIGTPATISSGAYIKAIREADPDVDIFCKACPLFVPLAEEGTLWWDNEVTESVAKIYLEELKEDGIDTLVLGCTHYPLLANAIRKVLGESVALVNSADEAAKSALRVLEEHDIKAMPGSGQKLSLYTSDSVEKFKPLCGAILNRSAGGLCVSHVNIEEY